MDSKEPRSLLIEVRRTGLTQSEVAKELGVTQGSVSKLEKGLTSEMHSTAFRKLLDLHRRVVKPARRSAQPKATA